MQSQGALHACLVEQTTISNMAQRNAAASAINDAAIAQQERATNNVNPAGESNTWQNYLP
jgi:type IV secretion system protein TrbJ